MRPRRVNWRLRPRMFVDRRDMVAALCGRKGETVIGGGERRGGRSPVADQRRSRAKGQLKAAVEMTYKNRICYQLPLPPPFTLLHFLQT